MISISEISSNEVNQIDSNFISLPLETCSVWETIKEAKGIIKIFIYLTFNKYFKDIFLCAIPFPNPKPAETKFSKKVTQLYLKMVFFYIPYSEANQIDRQFNNRMYWQNHFLNECSITDLPFKPIKQMKSQSKLKLKDSSRSNQAINVYDRCTVKLYNYCFIIILYFYSGLVLLDLILKLIMRKQIYMY